MPVQISFQPRQNQPIWLLLWVCLHGVVALSAQDVAPRHWQEGFEADDVLARIEAQGDVTVQRGSAQVGTGCLLITREQAAEMKPAVALLPIFTAAPGVWQVSAGMRGRLHSPDSSYHGSVSLEALADDGVTLGLREIGLVTGSSGWRIQRIRIELPEGTAKARFHLALNKTWGEFAIDQLSATHLGPSRRTVRAITFASDALGNLFLPDQPVRFTVTAESTRERVGADRQVVRCVVRDYWGVEQADSVMLRLQPLGRTGNGMFTYQGTWDLSDQRFETGRYYEIHAEMAEIADGAAGPARDASAFAVLPEARTRRHSQPFVVPFTASGWDASVPKFYDLVDRLGIRVANVGGGWTPDLRLREQTIAACTTLAALGMGALVSTPASSWERRRPGHQRYTEQVLRDGAKHMVETLGRILPIAIRMGNEPHASTDADTQTLVAVYRAIYQGCKAADPAVTVVGTSCGAEPIFFRNGYHDWLDVYDFHAYADAQGVRQAFRDYRELLAANGLRAKPVWTTEIGLNSQGMSREGVATEMIKIFGNFFAEGGVNLSWFGIMYPDPEGTEADSNPSSFDVFNARYGLYAPKLTAVTQYHLVNGIDVKRIIGQRTYPGNVVLTLFRDEADQCLLMAWKDGGRDVVRIPLAGVRSVQATRLDGSGAAFDAQAEGLTLGLADAGYLLTFTSASYALPDRLEEPDLRLAADPDPIVKGGEPTIIRLVGRQASAATLVVPPRWGVQRLDDDGAAVFALTAPAETAARMGRIVASLAGQGEILIPVAVRNPLDAVFTPVARDADGAGMEVLLTNRGQVPLTVRWQVGFPEWFAMEHGIFNLASPQPFAASFIGPSDGVAELPPGVETRVVVRAGNLDPLALYRARLDLSSGDEVQFQERYLGGNAGIPRAVGAMVCDGNVDESDWQRSPLIPLDQRQQVHSISNRGNAWEGAEDLSGTLRFLWDDRHLHVAVEVRDDVFRQPEVDGLLWRGDGLQFLIDPRRASATKPGKYDYGFALTAKGAQAWCFFTADGKAAPAGAVSDIQLAIVPGRNGGMVYEMAIPWHRLSPFVPAVGANLGLAMIINEDDGKGRDSFLAWFGCAHSKQMDMNGDLILLDHTDD